MKTINPKLVNKQLNKCYLEYDPEWRHNFQEERIYSFKSYIEHMAGLRLYFEPKVDQSTLKYGYEVKQVEIVNEPKFTMWLLRWS